MKTNSYELLEKAKKIEGIDIAIIDSLMETRDTEKEFETIVETVDEIKTAEEMFFVLKDFYKAFCKDCSPIQCNYCPAYGWAEEEEDEDVSSSLSQDLAEERLTSKEICKLEQGILLGKEDIEKLFSVEFAEKYKDIGVVMLRLVFPDELDCGYFLLEKFGDSGELKSLICCPDYQPIDFENMVTDLRTEKYI